MDCSAMPSRIYSLRALHSSACIPCGLFFNIVTSPSPGRAFAASLSNTSPQQGKYGLSRWMFDIYSRIDKRRESERHNNFS